MAEQTKIKYTEGKKMVFIAENWLNTDNINLFRYGWYILRNYKYMVLAQLSAVAIFVGLLLYNWAWLSLIGDTLLVSGVVLAFVSFFKLSAMNPFDEDDRDKETVGSLYLALSIVLIIISILLLRYSK